MMLGWGRSLAAAPQRGRAVCPRTRERGKRARRGKRALGLSSCLPSSSPAAALLAAPVGSSREDANGRRLGVWGRERRGERRERERSFGEEADDRTRGESEIRVCVFSSTAVRSIWLGRARVDRPLCVCVCECASSSVAALKGQDGGGGGGSRALESGAGASSSPFCVLSPLLRTRFHGLPLAPQTHDNELLHRKNICSPLRVREIPPDRRANKTASRLTTRDSSLSRSRPPGGQTPSWRRAPHPPR